MWLYPLADNSSIAMCICTNATLFSQYFVMLKFDFSIFLRFELFVTNDFIVPYREYIDIFLYSPRTRYQPLGINRLSCRS